MSHNEMVPGLIRMITVDNVTLPGRIEELPLDDHTAVIGGNQAGKTSLIQLVPVFYGERMAAVIDSHERKNFIHFYLPRDSSYLAFEYRNHDGEIRSVVMHSDPAKEKIQYRFIRGGLSGDMFHVINDDGTLSFISNAGFDNRLRDLSIDFAPRLIQSTKAYRGIIQGRIDDGTESRDRAYHRQLANEYGMSTSKAPLTGVERLLTQMLRNNVSMRNLLGVVAGQASETGQEVYKLLGDSSKEQIATWPKTFVAYRKVMDAEPKARELFAISHRISQHKDDIRERFDALKAFEEDFTARLDILQDELKTLSDTKGDATRRFETEIQELSDLIAAHRSEIGSLGVQIAQITAARDALLARGAETARAEVERLPAIEAALEAAVARHRLLASKGDDIVSRFDGERMALRDRIASEKSSATQAHEAGIEKIDADLEDCTMTMEARLSATEEEGRTREIAMRSDIDKLSEEHNTLRTQQGALQPDEDVALSKSSSEASLSEARERLELAKNNKTTAASAFKDADHTWQLVTRNLKDAERAVEHARIKRDEVTAEYNPKDGSLLSFLRRNAPDWGETIGKVIRPELLQKTNLSPDIQEQLGGSLYGLLIDIDKVDLPDHADQTILEARMMRASDAVAEAEKVYADQDAEVTKASRLRKQSADANSAAEAALGVAQNKFDIAKKANDTILDTVEVHLKAKGATLGREIERLKIQIDETRNHLDRHLSDLSQRLRDIRGEAAKRRDQLMQDKAKALAAHRAAMVELDSSMRTTEIQLKDDQQKALSEEGLDAAAISALKDTIEQMRKERETARKALALSEEWERHLEVARALPDLEARKSQATYSLQQDEAKLVAKKGEREQVIDGFNGRIETAEKTREQTSEALLKISAHLKAAPEFVSAEADRGSCFEKGYEINLQELGVFTKRMGDDHSAMKNSIRTLAGIFRNCGDAGISTYLDSKGLSGDYGNSWVPPILDWYEFEHINYRDTLMQGIGMIIEPMNIAYLALQKADREISSLNRKLAEAIRVNEGFPHIRDVKISIRSGITEQPSWALMEEVNRAHTAWKNSPSEQPPEDLINALDAFLGHWSGDKEPVLRIEDMIYIDGHMTEGDNLRQFSRNTDLAKLSSNGSIMVLRLIIFTALLSVMRRGRKSRLVWSVDEIGALDIKNTQNLLNMLKSNGIVLLTAAPTLERRVKENFTHNMRIEKKVLYRLGAEARNGIREWVADDQLDYPDLAIDADEHEVTTNILEGDAA